MVRSDSLFEPFSFPFLFSFETGQKLKKKEQRLPKEVVQNSTKQLLPDKHRLSARGNQTTRSSGISRICFVQVFGTVPGPSRCPCWDAYLLIGGLDCFAFFSLWLVSLERTSCRWPHHRRDILRFSNQRLHPFRHREIWVLRPPGHRLRSIEEVRMVKKFGNILSPTNNPLTTPAVF